MHVVKGNVVAPALFGPLAAALLAAAALAPVAGGAQENECDRACLNSVIDRYLAALEQRTPGTLSFDANLKATENGNPVKPGEGMWATSTGVTDYQIRLLDPRSGHAGIISVLEEGDKRTMFWTRLKLVESRITEMETIVARGAAPEFVYAQERLITARPQFSTPLPRSERRSRRQMIAAANSYYTGIEQGTGEGVTAFGEGCHRIENGVPTTNNPSFTFNRVSPDGRRVPNYEAMECMDQFNTGIWATDAIDQARTLVVDEETGVVAVNTIYKSKFKSNCTEARDFGTVCGAGGPRRDIVLVEVMKIRNGLIYGQESVWTGLPPGAGSGW